MGLLPSEEVIGDLNPNLASLGLPVKHLPAQQAFKAVILSVWAGTSLLAGMCTSPHTCHTHVLTLTHTYTLSPLSSGKDGEEGFLD